MSVKGKVGDFRSDRFGNAAKLDGWITLTEGGSCMGADFAIMVMSGLTLTPAELAALLRAAADGLEGKS